MKTWIKRVAGLALTFAMVLAMIPAISTKAETTYDKELTLYVGDTYSIDEPLWGYSDVTVGKVSNTKAIKITKVKNEKNKYSMEIKKASKKAVTFSVTYTASSSFYQTYTVNYKVTVKKPNLNTNISKIGDNKYLLTVKNTTKTAFKYLKLEYKLGDSKNDYVEIYDYLPVGATYYKEISYYNGDIVTGKKSAKVVETGQDFSYKYTDTTKKVSIKDSSEVSTDDYGSKQTTITLKYKNNYDQSVKGQVFVVLYDKSNNIIGVKDASFYSLNAKATDTDTVKIYHNLLSSELDHYKVQYYSFYKEYI